MRLTEDRFRDLVMEMIDENPFAIRAALKILDVDFTDEVPTLAVTLEERPRLLVNLAFLAENCWRDAHVKACIAHEFLHVLLNHTEQYRNMSEAENLALDAVINAIIHRSLGEEYSQFFLIYYRTQTGVGRLLRRRTKKDESDLRAQRAGQKIARISEFDQVWEPLYEGRLVADDILELAKDLPSIGLEAGRLLIGGHGHDGTLPQALAEALDEAMKEMDGGGIWRSPKDRGVGAGAYRTQIEPKNHALERWRATTLEVLKKCLVPDRTAALTEQVEADYRLPVLSTRDRRAFLQALWSPLIPEARWESTRERPLGRAFVYLDVSGSMDGEMPEIVALFGLLRKAIQMPFWAFSDAVHPATIEDGRLVTRTTGGTSMNCVLRHLAKARPPAAVVITDGYIERVDRALLEGVQGIRLHAVVTRDGNCSELAAAGIPYAQLEDMPHG
jgi:hypothetical protein